MYIITKTEPFSQTQFFWCESFWHADVNLASLFSTKEAAYEIIRSFKTIFEIVISAVVELTPEFVHCAKLKRNKFYV